MFHNLFILGFMSCLTIVSVSIGAVIAIMMNSKSRLEKKYKDGRNPGIYLTSPITDRGTFFKIRMLTRSDYGDSLKALYDDFKKAKKIYPSNGCPDDYRNIFIQPDQVWKGGKFRVDSDANKFFIVEEFDYTNSVYFEEADINRILRSRYHLSNYRNAGFISYGGMESLVRDVDFSKPENCNKFYLVHCSGSYNVVYARSKTRKNYIVSETNVLDIMKTIVTKDEDRLNTVIVLWDDIVDSFENEMWQYNSYEDIVNVFSRRSDNPGGIPSCSSEFFFIKEIHSERVFCVRKNEPKA